MTEEEKDSQKGFAVQPKLDCPHIIREEIDGLVEFLTNKNQSHFSQFQCLQCQDKGENWICLQCRGIRCSRYVKGHQADHNAIESHPIALSFSDGSYWCYACDSYIDSPLLRGARKALSQCKFAAAKEKEEQVKEEQEEEKKLREQLERMAMNQAPTPKWTLEQVIDGLKVNKFKRVVVLSGAGLSVAAGIPDFRSPGTGLYSQLQKYNLTYPQLIFTLDYFKKEPKPFLSLFNQCFRGEYKPTIAHHFIQQLQAHNILLMNLTQNIDDLQLKAGLSLNKLLQAHGHTRTAHCVACKNEVPMADWTAKATNMQILPCPKCGFFTKPDIVFFGEQLPHSFGSAPKIVEDADLVFIIGTSLKVMPFAYLAQLIPDDVPVLLLNREDSLQTRENKIWLKGDIEENARNILEKLGWLDAVLPKLEKKEEKKEESKEEKKEVVQNKQEKTQKKEEVAQTKEEEGASKKE